MTNPGSGSLPRITGLSAQTLDYESVFMRLRDGHTLITANSRLSRLLTDQYNHWRIEQGDLQWPSAKVFSWNLWLDKLWESASLLAIEGTDRAVPGTRQRVSLWESVLRNEKLAHKLLRPEALATQLLETRKLMVNWQLSFSDSSWFGDENENYAAFRLWNKAFEQRCEADGWISPEDRSALLCKALDNSQLATGGAIDLLGFDEFDPSQASLLAALISNGNELSQLSITPRQHKAVLWQARDSKDELRHMARWVRHWYEKEPASTIAIVVHDLHSRRQPIERQLQEILTPGSDHNDPQARPWNISMGTPLARVPMVETAFDLLTLLDKRIDIQDIGRVLRSPWLRGAHTERNSRALLEKCLRDKYPSQLTLGEIRYRAEEDKTRDRHGKELPADQHGPQVWKSPKLAGIIKTLIRFEADNRGKQPASAWAVAFDQLLSSLGWPLGDKPADESLSQAEHGQNWQALQSWREGLRELASLDATTTALGRHAAIKQLRQICREKIFQARTPPAPIQVLGLYEVSGLRFDHLWVLGLHNDTWPPGARPNPFIPGKLQQAAQTPNASPQRELEVARTITRRLLETAPDCVFSYPGLIDGEEALASPLLTSAEITPVTEIDAWQGEDWRGTVANADKPQTQPLSMPGALQHGTARGGSTILTHQALCPFRAFASNRLGAEGLETPNDGISPMLHGSLVHQVLEGFWKETRNQAALLALGDEDLGERVRKYVEDVTTADRGLQQRPAFQKVEADRIYRHVMDYLELEKQRDSFEVIGFEEEILPEIQGQTVRLIIDRIDRLPSGAEIIIDYKTGKKEPKKWFGERPEDSQLPLYAITAKNTPAAVVFGIIRDDGCEYKGVVQQDGLLPGLPPKATKTNQYLVDAGHNMPATIDNWRQTLHRLMADFLAGEASIDPKRGTTTCDNSYCELHSLCRITELEEWQKAARQDTQADGQAGAST